MAEGSAGDGKRWLKYGCFGCLGCIGLILIVVGMSLILAYFRAKSEKAEDTTLTHPVPAAPAAPAKPGTPPSTHVESRPVDSPAKGTLELEFQDAEFHIEPGKPGDPIRVEAAYDKSFFELTEHSEQLADESWLYRVQFRRTKSGGFVGHIMQHFFSKIRPTVHVYIPPDAPMALDASIERGGLEIELGGTRVTAMVLDVSMGGVDLKVSEPLETPMERFALNSHMGGGEIRRLGNASPRVVEVSSQMGGVDLDLRGMWRADAEINLHGSMGGTSVRLPDGVRIEGVPGHNTTAPQAGELKLPTLRFSSSSEMGEVEFK